MMARARARDRRVNSAHLVIDINSYRHDGLAQVAIERKITHNAARCIMQLIAIVRRYAD